MPFFEVILPYVNQSVAIGIVIFLLWALTHAWSYWRERLERKDQLNAKRVEQELEQDASNNKLYQRVVVAQANAIKGINKSFHELVLQNRRAEVWRHNMERKTDKMKDAILRLDPESDIEESWTNNEEKYVTRDDSGETLS